MDIKIINYKSSAPSFDLGNGNVIPKNIPNMEEAERSTTESEPMHNLEMSNYEINHETPDKSTEENIQGKLVHNLDVPSPFKRVIFWPEEKVTNLNNKRKREKIPSVITSELWQEYSRKKMEKKKLGRRES